MVAIEVLITMGGVPATCGAGADCLGIDWGAGRGCSVKGADVQDASTAATPSSAGVRGRRAG
ncbi:hypothetical protein GCM10028796_58400 [Ramlibacter monticola]